MTEQTQNIPDFSNRPQLDQNPQKLDIEVSKKDSALNQDLKACAQWLKDNKDKAGTDEYMKHFEALESMAQKGYPMAEFEYAKFLMDTGELNKAAIFFDKAKQNKNADPELKKEINETAPDSQKDKEDKKDPKQPLQQKESKEEKLKREPYKTLNAHAHKTEKEARKESFQQEHPQIMEQINSAKRLGQG